MSVFSINETAATEIEHMLNQSMFNNPVVSLGETAEADDSFGELKSAFLGGASEEELLAIGKKKIEEVGDTLTYTLAVFLDERDKCQAEDLIQIDEIDFAMQADIRDALSDYCLEYEDGKFFLRNANGIAKNLRSVAKLTE